MDRKAPENVEVSFRDAQEWCRLPSLGSPASRAAFASWVSESPSNLAAYLMSTMLGVEMSSLDSERQLDLTALIASATQQAQSPLDEPHQQSAPIVE